MNQSRNDFDSCEQALDFISELEKHKKTGKLSCTLIEGVYRKNGDLIDGLWEWHVKQ